MHDLKGKTVPCKGGLEAVTDTGYKPASTIKSDRYSDFLLFWRMKFA